MNTDKFFETLQGFYSKIGKTGTQCRFFCQAKTFSFELHDSSRLTFSDDSLVFYSEVYSFWMSPKEMSKIIKDIKKKAKEFKEGKIEVWVPVLSDETPKGDIVYYKPGKYLYKDTYKEPGCLPHFVSEHEAQEWCNKNPYKGKWLWKGKDKRK